MIALVTTAAVVSTFNAPARHAWVALDAPTKLVEREVIPVGKAAGRFTRLELVAARGTTEVSKIAIKFANGQTEMIALGSSINPRTQPRLTVDLAGHDARSIAKIVVFGNGHGRSAFEVNAI